MPVNTNELTVTLRSLHPKQAQFVDSKAKRKVVRAGRRSGKTVGVATLAVDRFLDGRRVLYAAPTVEQTERFWFEVCKALQEPIAAKVYAKNETERTIERPGTQNRIRAKTAWNADTLRGDYADLLILDEWQLMNEDTWEVVGAPMLLDNDGDAVFIYTPPSLHSSGTSKARDPRHAAKMFKTASEDKTGRWAAFHFTSHDNPYISQSALADLVHDMSHQSYRQEILAEDDDVEAGLLVYRAFDWVGGVVDRFPIPETWFSYSGHDFGISNPAALFVAQNPANADLYVYREYLPGPGKSTPQHVEAFKALEVGKHAKSVGGNHAEEEIRAAYRAHDWHISEPALAVKGINEQIDRVIGLMEAKRVHIFRDLVHLQEEISSCCWKVDTAGVRTDKIDNGQRYHLLDCLRYIGSDFTPETVNKSFVSEVKYW